MSFVWKAAKPLLTEEQVARTVHGVSLARGLDELASVLALMCIRQESDFWCPWNAKDPASKNYPYDSQSDDGRSVGYYQQQNGRAGDTLPAGDRDDWWGPMASRMDLAKSTDVFLGRLADDYTAATNGAVAGQFIQRVQRSAYPDAYAKHWDYCWSLLRRALADQTPTTPEVPVPVSGDPVWLEDVLRPALGDRLKTLPGWESDGVGGTMGNIWGVIWHHTGNAAEKPESISVGRPDLSGPLAQIHIAPDGIVTIVAVGPCNHAGAGSWPGLPTDNANAYTIGIECAWPRDTSLTEATASREPWPDAQIISMRDVGAALTKHLGVPVSHNISHREWARFGPAGQRQFKWDPGNLDMDWFRGEIQKDIDGFEFPGEHPEVTPPAEPKPVVVGPADDQLTYRWNCLGGQTVVEALAEIRDAVKGTDDRGKTGVVTQ